MKRALNWVVLMLVYAVEIRATHFITLNKPYKPIHPMHGLPKAAFNRIVQLIFAYKLFVGFAFQSCLHYNNHAFSKNDGDTLQSIEDPTRRFGQRDDFSAHDILQVNELYNCQVTDLHEKMRDVAYD